MYRFCMTDPMRFYKSIRITLEHGHANDNASDYSSVAFWYQNEPHDKADRIHCDIDRMSRAGSTPLSTDAILVRQTLLAMEAAIWSRSRD
jgi:hypothetical protein